MKLAHTGERIRITGTNSLEQRLSLFAQVFERRIIWKRLNRHKRPPSRLSRGLCLWSATTGEGVRMARVWWKIGGLGPSRGPAASETHITNVTERRMKLQERMGILWAPNS